MRSGRRGKTNRGNTKGGMNVAADPSFLLINDLAIQQPLKGDFTHEKLSQKFFV
jgi:hypothetical protein